MKKIVSVFVLSVIASGMVYAQQTIRLRMGFKPETKYDQSFGQNGKTRISYSGSEEIMETLKAQGQDSVMEIAMESEMQTIIKTGKADKTGKFPLSCEFTSVKNNMPNGGVTVGTKLFGKASTTTLPVYDSAYAPDMDKDAIDKLLATMSGMLSQMKIPDTTMKAGDVYVQKMPVAIPVGAMSMDMVIVTTYKLNSIEKNIGYFDVDQEYTMNITNEQMDLPLKGTGKGRMEFDAANNFLRLYTVDLEMTMATNIQGIDMNMITNMKTDLAVKLVK